MLRSTFWCCLFAAACSDDGSNGSVDAGTADAGRLDAATMPDGNPSCLSPTQALPYEWRPIDAVSIGPVETTGTDVKTTFVNATAGGSTAYGENPFNYLDLVGGGAKVEITDVAAYSSEEWDLALKRYVIRVNGGDSGPAAVAVAPVAAASLDEVVASPADSAFATDDWADGDCNLVTGPLGEPLTAMGSWYEYDVNTHTVTPTAQVFVLKLRDGTKIKLRIDTYYADLEDPMRGAYYRLKWAVL